MGTLLRDVPDPTALGYHRRIRLVGSVGEVQGDLADGPHHFRVWISHDGAQVTGIRGEAVRNPWTSCPAAALELRRLIGMPLQRSTTAVGRFAIPTHNCTHMFDLAGLVVAHALRGVDERNYHCHVRQDSEGLDHAICQRDGEVVMTWQFRAGVIEGPAPFVGVPLQSKFIQWAEANLGEEEAEVAILMRRACFVSPVRFVDVTQWERATDVGNGAVCYTFQPERAPDALRVEDSYLDCQDEPERLLGD